MKGLRMQEMKEEADDNHDGDDDDRCGLMVAKQLQWWFKFLSSLLAGRSQTSLHGIALGQESLKESPRPAEQECVTSRQIMLMQYWS